MSGYPTVVLVLGSSVLAWSLYIIHLRSVSAAIMAAAAAGRDGCIGDEEDGEVLPLLPVEKVKTAPAVVYGAR